MTRGSARWKRFMWGGLAAHGTLVLLIATLAYQGALWSYLPAIPHFDLAGHFVLIGGLAFFLDGVLGYRPLTRGSPSWLRMAPVLILSLAAVEELAQAWTPRRTSSVSDFLADVVGVVGLSWLSYWMAGRTSP
jgi:hypothetical protein